ncbi:MAG: hypothetical protein WAT21_11890 [Saprospiraceae bacterium]
MKLKGVTLVFWLLSTLTFAQAVVPSTPSNKGKLYVFWGWNRTAYSKSDIRFNGNNYDFTLRNVKSIDKKTKFDLNTYFNPSKATIPQYNFRVGYFINSKYNVSIGVDHMKYVVRDLQDVKISGYIHSGSEYDGLYKGESIQIKEGFLAFEHTDGLNYINLEFRRFEEIIKHKIIRLNITAGIGGGVLLPKSDVTLLNQRRNDEFHLAGYGMGAILGINIPIWKYFFLQSEFKEGFIHLPDIRTTQFSSDKAHQSFFFSQWNLVFGASFPL